MSKRKKSNSLTRLIVASSDHDPDMLYATRMFVPDPFIFLEQNGKRTIVLSDLEIDRGRKQAQADEIVALQPVRARSAGQRGRGLPALRRSCHTFCVKRRVRSAVVPDNFPLRYAEELAEMNIRVQAANGLFWPERETKRTTSCD